MKDYATPKLVIYSFDGELLTADIVRASALSANEHEQDDGFNVGWFN